ncbi:MAG TPA: C40 family peptidase [Burkholderiales bacterium]|nr:C40 family peptidase [Burkholderiales bacterium]
MKIFAALAALGIALAASPACSADTARDEASDSYLSRAREVTIQALSFLGVNYKWGSSNPERGFDCSGLVTHVFQQVAGMVLPRNSQSMSKVGEKIDKVDLQPGDLVFFNTRRQPNSHVGIYIGDERFVHAPSRGGEVEISDMQESYWKKRFNGARRLLNSD